MNRMRVRHFVSGECCKICGPQAIATVQFKSAAAMWLMLGIGCGGTYAQTLPGARCGSETPPAFCGAVRGARAEGWPAQSRSEVMAQHGMVVTSQPLAAQAGLQILMRGGNAIDAAVATAAVLNVTEPMMVGMGGDLFAVIYIAKE